MQRRRRLRRRGGSAWLQRAVPVLLVLTVVAAVMAIGTVHVPVLLGVSAVAVVTGVVAVLGGGRVTWPALVLGGLGLWTALQAVPLPRGWVEWLAPANLRIWDEAVAPLGEGGPSLVSLSLDPGATWVEAVKLVAYAGVFVASCAVAARRGPRFGVLLLFGSSLLVAVTTLVHGVVDASQVYGFYEPRLGGARWRVSPLINPNNLAGYSNLGLLAGASLLAASRPPLPRWLIGLAVAVVLAGSLLTGSRGGLGALALSSLLLLLLLRDLRRYGDGEVAGSFRGVALGGLATALGGLALVVAATGERSLRLLLSQDVEKLQVASAAVPMVREHPVIGIGRGAFESVFPSYLLGEGNVVYAHAENFPVQWITEWGLPVGGALLAGFLWFLRPARWGTRDSVEACGLYAGFVALTLQNLVDLSFEVPGVMITAVAAAGFAVGSTGQGDEAPGRRLRWAAAGALAVLGALFIGLAGLRGLQTVALDRDAVQDAFPETLTDLAQHEAFMGTVRAAILRHPAEPYFPRTAAVAVWRARKVSPMPWFQQALSRSLTSARTHLLLAALLAERGATKQALMELRFVVEQTPPQAGRAARLAVRLTQDPDDLSRAVPEGVAGGEMFLALARALTPEQSEVRLEFLRRALGRNPDLDAARSLLIEQLVAALGGGAGAARCEGPLREGCEQDALREVQRYAERRPEAEGPVVLKAKVLGLQGKGAEALALLASRCHSLDPRSACLREWLRSAVSVKDHEQQQQVIRALELDGCTDHHRCAGTLTDVADQLMAGEEAALALGFYERAAREEPSPQRWRRVAKAASAAGDHARAAAALEQAAQGRRDRATSKEIDQERLRALQDEAEGPGARRTRTRTPPAASEAAPASSAETTRMPSRRPLRRERPSITDRAK